MSVPTITYSVLVFKGRADCGYYEETGQFADAQSAHEHLIKQAKTYYYTKLLKTETMEINQ